MKELEKLSTQIRISSLKMVHQSGASHISSALSITDILSTLYGKVLNYDSNNENLESRDSFILSKGHACVAVYAVLAEVGFFEKSYLESYGEDFSDLMNHISHKVPGVEFSTGALGHGLPMLILTILRVLLINAIIASVFIIIYNKDISYIWYSIILSSVITATIAYIWMKYINIKLINSENYYG